MSLVEKFLTEEDDKIIKHAEIVDKIDRIIGPIESTLQLYGGETGNLIGNLLSIAEIIFLKAPFIYKYLKRTGDYDALTGWLPKEIFAYMVNFGDFIDIHNSYKNRTRAYYEHLITGEEIEEDE